MDHHENKPETSPVTLEDLLKLKRHEKPDDAFWNTFEKDFKKRTLQELVTRPSLRQAFAQWLANSGSRWIPATAVAAVAVIFTNNTLVTSVATHTAHEPIDTALAASQDAVEAPVTQSPVSELAVIESATSTEDMASVWEDAQAEYDVDVIIATSSSENATRTFSTDFTPDTIGGVRAVRASYAEDAFTTHVATLHPSSFRLGM